MCVPINVYIYIWLGRSVSIRICMKRFLIIIFFNNFFAGFEAPDRPVQNGLLEVFNGQHQDPLLRRCGQIWTRVGCVDPRLPPQVLQLGSHDPLAGGSADHRAVVEPGRRDVRGYPHGAGGRG